MRKILLLSLPLILLVVIGAALRGLEATATCDATCKLDMGILIAAHGEDWSTLRSLCADRDPMGTMRIGGSYPCAIVAPR